MIMASSSSPPLSPSSSGYKYDVYLSFHGTDTGTGFISHLVAALVRNQIEVAPPPPPPPPTDQTGDGDDDHIATGFRRVTSEKMEQSHVYVVVFSGSYPESERCLDELVHVAELVKASTEEQTAVVMALPVFYRVDPTDVQELTGRYGQDVMAGRHGEVLRKDPDRVETWKRALREISNKSGRVLQDSASEATLIEEIVNDIWKKLESLPAGDLDDGFVGMDSRVEEVESLISIAEVRGIGVWGMGGIGKTALAENLYNRIAANFEGRCFVNVREELERCTLVALRDRVLSAVLNVEGLRIGTPKMLPSPIRRKLQRTRALVVLDDVCDHQEWETLAGRHLLYGPGSKIIVTSRDKQVLQTACDQTYEVKRLGYRYAWRLFKRHAFEHDIPTEMHVDLARRVLKYADGIPLALKVLGCSLYSKGVREWEGMLEKLGKIPDKEITQVLRVTFEELEHQEKSIFLDIACFFNDAEKDHVERFWDACGFYPTSGIRNLKDKSLVEFSKNRVRMHDLLRQMGWDIVRQECIQEPGNRSRLWDPKDVHHALSKQRVSEKIEGISLDMLRAGEMKLSPAIFSEMHSLRLLRFYILCSSDTKIHLPDGLHSLPDQLRLLHWTQYPLKYLPLKFGCSNLVELDLQNSRIEKLWDSDQCMGSLKIINLSNSRGLIRIADPSTIPNVEDLNLRGCWKLEEVPSSIGLLRKLEWLTLDGCRELQEIPSSLGCLKNLNYLSLADCTNLCRFPSCADMTNLEYLSLFFCPKLKEFPQIPMSIKKLELSGTAIQDVPSSIGQFTRLVKLGLGYCPGLKSLPSSIGDLQNLEELYLVGCSKLAGIRGCSRNLTSLASLRMTCQDADGLPEDLGNLLSLEELIIVESAIKDVPRSVSHLSRLKDLSFWKCKSIAFSPFAALSNLSIVHIMDCGISEIPDGLGSLTSLTELHLREPKLKSIPASIKGLSNLVVLKAQACKKLQLLPELPPRLKLLDVYNCTTLRSVSGLCSLVEFHPDHGASEEEFTFANCFNLDEDTRDSIVHNAEQKILRFLDWMLNEEFDEMDPDEEQHPSSRQFTVDITSCLPGTQVPGWFEHQTAGSSITITTDSHTLLDLRRFAFCAVVTCNEPFALEAATIRCDVNVYTKSSSGRALKLHSFYQSPAFLEDFGERFLRSDHVFVWYNSNLCHDQSQCHFAEASFEFYPVDWEGRKLSTCEVVSCGVSAVGRKFGVGTVSSGDEGDDIDDDEEEEEVEESLLKR